MLRKRRRLSGSEDDDPMASLTNLSDAMLVLALGFLIFAIMAVSTNPDIISDATSQSSQSSVKVSSGESFNDSSSGGASDGSGFDEVGKVYKDPNTGKLVMVSSCYITRI